MSRKTLEIEFLLLHCCLKPIAFLGSFDKSKIINCVNLLLIESQAHANKYRKGAPKVARILATQIGKKIITLRSLRILRPAIKLQRKKIQQHAPFC